MTDPSTPNPNPSPPSNRAAMFTVFFVIVIDLLGFGIVLPLLPRYADEMLPKTAVDSSVHGLVIGVLMSIFSFMQFLFAPIWGRISDRVGRRPILLIGLVGSAGSYALFGYASSLDDAKTALILIFVSRVFAGIAGATISTAQAVIADSTSKEKRAHGMAIIGAAFGIGFTLGPIIAAIGLAVAPEQKAFAGYTAAGLSTLALIYALAKMPETRKPGVGGPRRGWIDPAASLRTLKVPEVGLLVLIFFLATFGFAKFEGTLSLLTKDAGYSDQANFWIFAYVGFVLMMTQGMIYRRMVKKMDEVSLMRIGTVFMFLGLAGLAGTAVMEQNTVRTALFFVSLACGVFGFAFMTPSAQALISKRSSPDQQGEILGVNQSFSALARILGPTAGIVLFKAHDSHVLPYAASAVLLCFVMLLLPRIRKGSVEQTTTGH